MEEFRSGWCKNESKAGKPLDSKSTLKSNLHFYLQTSKKQVGLQPTNVDYLILLNRSFGLKIMLDKYIWLLNTYYKKI